MKKSIFTIITLLVISMSSASAQVIWGLRAGASIPTLSISAGGGSVSADGKFSFEVGPTLYYGLKDNWYLNSGAMYSLKRFDSGDSETFNMHYLEIPLYLGYAIPLGSVQTYVQAGPYIGFKLSESFADRSEIFDADYYDESGVSNFNAGIGIMYGINIKKFKIEAGYQYGLANILELPDDYDDYDGPKLKARLNSLFLGVSYVF
ncbi:MAG: PorT family protein [Candidatus Symbiothrix sp.]|jgi:hypothetical protein|nr:PorT family protein [Candidatus Symbiothrix sp.]